jgi:hypothetical protein
MTIRAIQNFTDMPGSGVHLVYGSWDEQLANYRRRLRANKKGKVHVYPVRAAKGLGYMVGGREHVTRVNSKRQILAERFCQDRTPIPLVHRSRAYGEITRAPGMTGQSG